jgi:hypothetical protein
LLREGKGREDVRVVVAAAAAGGLASSAVIDVDGRKMFLPPQWLQQDRFIVFAFAKLPNRLYIHDINLEARGLLFDVSLRSPLQLITKFLQLIYAVLLRVLDDVGFTDLSLLRHSVGLTGGKKKLQSIGL